MSLLNNEQKVFNPSCGNELRIIIDIPREEVFEFVLEPNNTPRWIDFISEESIDTEQIGIGTIYSNDFGQLKVSDYERNVYFELNDEDKPYQRSYSFRKVDEDTTEIIYFECMTDGSELQEPFDKKHFEVLKEILEN